MLSAVVEIARLSGLSIKYVRLPCLLNEYARLPCLSTEYVRVSRRRDEISGGRRKRPTTPHKSEKSF